jgi:hypothetical protein
VKDDIFFWLSEWVPSFSEDGRLFVEVYDGIIKVKDTASEETVRQLGANSLGGSPNS